MIAGGLLDAGARVIVSSRKADDVRAAAERAERAGGLPRDPRRHLHAGGGTGARGGCARALRLARHPRQQRRRLLGRADRGVPRVRLGEGARHERGRDLPPHRRAPARVARRGECRGPGAGDQHRLDQRARATADGELQLQREQGRRAHAHPPSRQAPRRRAHHGQRDRPRTVREQNDGLRARQPGDPRAGREQGAARPHRVTR